MGVNRRLPRNLGWALQRARDTWQEEGPKEFGRRTVTYVRRRGLSSVSPRHRMPRGPVRAGRWPGSVLVVASRQPQQCFHYRVEQKAQACGELGIPFAVVDPADHVEALSQVQLAGLVVIFRQAESATTKAVAAEARRLGVPVVFEADDLVYRRDLVAANPNLETVARDLRTAVVNGADGYLSGLRLADHVLASTDVLAADMQRFVRGSAFVMDNGIDARMLQIAQGIADDPAPPSSPGIVVGYGSGSRAHDRDLAVAAGGLAAVMAQHDDVRLRLIGPLRVPDELARFGDRIERLAELPYGEYLRQLASCDIAIAPLLDHPFNVFKSQVKYLEAGLVGVPFVGSPVLYGRYVRDGDNGLLAGPTQWAGALARLVAEPGLRAELAAAAAKDVEQYLVPQRPARQLAGMLDALGVIA